MHSITKMLRPYINNSPIPFAPVLEREILPDDEDVYEAAVRCMDYGE